VASFLDIIVVITITCNKPRKSVDVGKQSTGFPPGGVARNGEEAKRLRQEKYKLLKREREREREKKTNKQIKKNGKGEEKKEMMMMK